MTDVSRFWAKVIRRDGGCWEWTAAKTRGGYGRFRLPTKHVIAHRFSYELARGPIPEGQPLDHLCRNRVCVNPDHLEPVTSRENTLRGESVVAANARKTHCKRNHPLSGANLYVLPGGGRRCRTCMREARRAYEARLQAARSAA